MPIRELPPDVPPSVSHVWMPPNDRTIERREAAVAVVDMRRQIGGHVPSDRHGPSRRLGKQLHVTRAIQDHEAIGSGVHRWPDGQSRVVPENHSDVRRAECFGHARR